MIQTSVPQLSVAIPCYNEAPCLAALHQRVSAACSSTVGSAYEIVLVNDGSVDETWPAIRSLADRDSHVVGVNLSRNHGHQLALTAGLSVCRGERILIIDADLQDPPELLSEMMSLMNQGADVVYGQRRSRAGETWFKKTTAALFYRFLRSLSDIEIPVDTGDFRLVSRRALDTLLAMPERDRFIRGMVAWMGFKQVPLVYARAERLAGTTKYPLKKMVRFAIDAITSFSVRPLRLASLFGLFLFIPTMALLAYVIYSWFTDNYVRGWASLMTLILFIGTMQMFLLGVIGEYLGRLFLEVKGRPLFIIKEVIGANQAATTGEYNILARHGASARAHPAESRVPG